MGPPPLYLHCSCCSVWRCGSKAALTPAEWALEKYHGIGNPWCWWVSDIIWAWRPLSKGRMALLYWLCAHSTYCYCTAGNFGISCYFDNFSSLIKKKCVILRMHLCSGEAFTSCVLVLHVVNLPIKVHLLEKVFPLNHQNIKLSK